VLHRGSVIAQGDFSTLSTIAAVQEAYLGFA
jgi:ABC-type branched-subunit amino acid transport system ATPase component